MDVRYIAKPYYLYTYALPLLLAGAFSIALTSAAIWFWIGVLLIFFGVGLGTWVVYDIHLQAHSDHAERIAYNTKVLAANMTTMARIKDANVWAAIGYEMPTPQPANLTTPQLDAPNSPPQRSFPTPPATDPQMKLFSNSVLRGNTMSEGEWGGPGKVFSEPKYRQLMKWGEHPDRNYWRFVNPAYKKLGRVPTRAGIIFLLFYADPEVKVLYETKHMSREEVGLQFGNRPKELGREAGHA